MTKGQRLNIGDLSKVTGVKVVTIRYYEQIGLMPVAPRNKGTGDLHGEYIRRLQFIRRLRDLGFSVSSL
jgi:DNA-binding transcriptional MerR regulator